MVPPACLLPVRRPLPEVHIDCAAAAAAAAGVDSRLRHRRVQSRHVELEHTETRTWGSDGRLVALRYVTCVANTCATHQYHKALNNNTNLHHIYLNAIRKARRPMNWLQIKTAYK